MPRLIQPLPAGPLDIIGDVHGELDALLALLGRLGVDLSTNTVERPLVFVGDLVDRGPDSVGVVDLVRSLVDDGVASMVLGNHELNVLRGLQKEGNGWLLGHADGAWFDGELRRFDAASATAAWRDEALAWFAERPLGLVRDDLRVVHACWDVDGIDRLPVSGDPALLADAFDEMTKTELRDRGVVERARQERRTVGPIDDATRRPKSALPFYAALTVAQHARNPVRSMTSGLEHAVPLDEYAFLGGKWRVTARSPWWDRWDRPEAVVVGHYWRTRRAVDHRKPDIWGPVPRFGWGGPRQNVFCVDYSVGMRYRERWRGRTAATGFYGGLAALRWPEREVVFDDGFAVG